MAIELYGKMKYWWLFFILTWFRRKWPWKRYMQIRKRHRNLWAEYFLSRMVWLLSVKISILTELWILAIHRHCQESFYSLSQSFCTFFSKTKPLGSYFASPHRTFTLFKFVFPLRNLQTSDVHLQSSFKCSFRLATITCTSHSGRYARNSQLLVWF